MIDLNSLQGGSEGFKRSFKKMYHDMNQRKTKKEWARSVESCLQSIIENFASETEKGTTTLKLTFHGVSSRENCRGDISCTNIEHSLI